MGVVMRASALLIATVLLFSPEGWAQDERITIEGLNDPLEPSIQIYSYRFKKPDVIYPGEWDLFLRAFYSKEEKAFTGIQVYITTNSLDWRLWRHARYLDGGKLREVEVYEIGTGEVDCSRGYCSHYETVGFNVTEAQLRRWAQQNEDVRIRLISRIDSRDMRLPVEEIRVFLQAMDHIRNSQN